MYSKCVLVCGHICVIHVLNVCVCVYVLHDGVCVCVCESLGVLCNNLQASHGHLVHCQPLSL